MLYLRPGERSIERALYRWLLALTLVLSLVAGAASALLAFWEVHEAQDDVLLQFARVIPSGAVTNVAGDAWYGEDDDSTIIVEPLPPVGEPRQSARLGLTHDHTDGFSTFEHDDDSWRVLVVSKPNDSNGLTRFAVAQQTELRNEIALASGLSAALPIAALALILSLVIRWVVRSSMRPIRMLSTTLDAREADDLDPLDARVALQDAPAALPEPEGRADLPGGAQGAAIVSTHERDPRDRGFCNVADHERRRARGGGRDRRQRDLRARRARERPLGEGGVALRRAVRPAALRRRFPAGLHGIW